MATKIIMPQLGLTMTEGTVSKWLKAVGESISVGDELVEIETDKISNIVESHVDGILLKICLQEGGSAPVKAILGYIGEAGEIIEGEGVASAGDLSAEPKTMSDDAQEALAAIDTDNGIAKGSSVHENGWVLATPLARHLAKEENIDLAFVSGTGPNGRVTEKDFLAYLQEIKVKTTPTAAKVADDLGVDIHAIDTTGRITKADVLAIAEAGMTAEEPLAGLSTGTIIEGEPLKGMRKVIAERLSESWRTVPHVHHTVEINVNEAGTLREKLASLNKKVTITDLIIKAMAKVLEEYPAANNSLVNGKLICNEHINIGVAVALENGLIVPVIRDANYKSLLDIHNSLAELAYKAREGTLLPDEYSGGTFTISNLGMYGCDHFTPIINPPEACILGVCRAVNKPIVIDGDISIAPMMNAILGYDHRIVDGATAGLVTQRLREYMEDPILLI